MTNKQQQSDDYRLLLSPAFAAMSKITENIFLTGVGGMTRENFTRNHIDFVVNITLDAPFWPNIESIRIAIEDDSSSNMLAIFDHVVERMHDYIVRRNAHILVHCVAGVSRSPTIVIAYLMKIRRFNLKQAFNHCYGLRPVIRPNNGFMIQLISYEQRLFNRVSVRMVEVDVDGTLVWVPNFFIEEHPHLVMLEVLRTREELEKKQRSQSLQQQQQQQQPQLPQLPQLPPLPQLPQLPHQPPPPQLPQLPQLPQQMQTVQQVQQMPQQLQQHVQQLPQQFQQQQQLLQQQAQQHMAQTTRQQQDFANKRTPRVPVPSPHHPPHSHHQQQQQQQHHHHPRPATSTTATGPRTGTANRAQSTLHSSLASARGPLTPGKRPDMSTIQSQASSRISMAQSTKMDISQLSSRLSTQQLSNLSNLSNMSNTSNVSNVSNVSNMKTDLASQNPSQATTGIANALAQARNDLDLRSKSKRSPSTPRSD